MSKQHRLFAVTHWLLKAATGLSIFIAAVLILALGGVLVAALNLDGNHLGIPADIEGVARIDALKIAVSAMSGGFIVTVLIWLGLRSTTEIVETAISGDPFVGENAKRLTRIGWLLLSVNVAGFVAQLTVTRLVTAFVPENLRHQMISGLDMSPIGLLAVLLIFVLAQIFRRGSEMRSELEGTV